MPELNFREQSLVNSLEDRLKDADAFTVDAALSEIENSEAYKNPSHLDHHAFLNMIPVAMGRQMTLSGDDPHRGTRGIEGALDAQNFTHDPYPQEAEPDDSIDEQGYNRERTNAQNYLNRLQNGEMPNVSEDEIDIHIKAAQQTIIDIDMSHNNDIQARDTELARRDEQENSWADEQVTRAAEMKKDFMAVRMKNVLPDDKAAYQKLANEEWDRMASDYGF